MKDNVRSFVDESVRYLEQVHLDRIRRGLETLDEADVWWRPGPDSLAFGTILLHLEGNLREWILTGLGDRPQDRDRRDRDAEFAANDGDARAMFQRLEATVQDACGVIRNLDDGALARNYEIQGRTVTGLEALYHVVEHFAYHAGQAMWISKARA